MLHSFVTAPACKQMCSQLKADHRPAIRPATGFDAIQQTLSHSGLGVVTGLIDSASFCFAAFCEFYRSFVFILSQAMKRLGLMGALDSCLSFLFILKRTYSQGRLSVHNERSDRATVIVLPFFSTFFSCEFCALRGGVYLGWSLSLHHCIRELCVREPTCFAHLESSISRPAASNLWS